MRGTILPHTKRPRILCIAESVANFNPLLHAISLSGYQVSLAFTTDQGVAACMNNHIAAVVLDAMFMREADWPVAKSLKLIKPSLPILLLDGRDASRTRELPGWIDAVASKESPEEVLARLKDLLATASAAGADSALG